MNIIKVVLFVLVAGLARAAGTNASALAAQNKACTECHVKTSPGIVMQWKASRHAQFDVGCLDCHAAEPTEADAWQHEGAWISALVTPKDCGQCHEAEAQQFAVSHHARAGEIIASLDNVLAEKAAGTATNTADAVSGCWQCHGTVVKFQRDAKGAIVREKNGKPLLSADSWPNSGIGRLNPDGSRGTCNACHSRHSFEPKLARSPDNCGKCHMGPDHPQIEIYNESKHGIAFRASQDRMALTNGSWVLGKDYAAAPTCASCHMGSYMKTNGTMAVNSHDVGERISWTLRPVISSRLNQVVFADGTKEDYPDSRTLPKVGEEIVMTEKVVKDEKLVGQPVTRRVAKIVRWEERRANMQGACLNCHNSTFVGNFYKQYDDLVTLYNDKFARQAQQLIDELTKDGALNPKAPFEHDLQWTFYELWHHEGRRARHGASMMGPDYTHWHGMYEVSKHFYEKFLPQVVEVAAKKSPALKQKYEQKVADLMGKDEHRWKKGLSAEEAEAMQKSYQQRYGK